MAQQVLLGNTRGYRNHPQLNRFKSVGNPVGAIATYLRQVAREAGRRGYHFDAKRIAAHRTRQHLPVSDGQLRYEFQHLVQKLKLRSPGWYEGLADLELPKMHPMFELYRGDVEEWEVRK